MPGDGYSSLEIALCTDKIVRCIGRIVGLMEAASDGALLAPPMVGANSLVQIVNHVLANVEDNLLGVVGGRAVAPDTMGTIVIRSWRPVRSAPLDGTAPQTNYCRIRRISSPGVAPWPCT